MGCPLILGAVFGAEKRVLHWVSFDLAPFGRGEEKKGTKLGVRYSIRA